MTLDGKTGMGECSIIEGLSPESPEIVEDILEEIPRYIRKGKDFLLKRYNSSPAMQFALEMAFSGLESSHPLLHFDTAFVHDQQMIPINGLIWMSDVESMMTQLNQKLNLGFPCIKIKVGALDFGLNANCWLAYENDTTTQMSSFELMQMVLFKPMR